MLNAIEQCAGFIWSIFVALGEFADLPLLTVIGGEYSVSAGNPFTSYVFTIEAHNFTIIDELVAHILEVLPQTSQLTLFGAVLGIVPLYFVTMLAVRALKYLLPDIFG